LLDGNVLAILPTGAGKTAVLTVFILVLAHRETIPDEFTPSIKGFPEDPTAPPFCAMP